MNAPEKLQISSYFNVNLFQNSEPSFWTLFYRNFFKRLVDLFFATLSLPFVIPILLILMILIKLDSKGPAIFKSLRIGKGGKNFEIYKLRTMCVNADEKLSNILGSNEKLKLEWESDHKLRNDPRITRFGKIIRALSLDEIPQIFNVLKGEMSFVGPRPIVQAEAKKYGEYLTAYTSILPGITGLWQTNGRNDASYNKRIALDSKYAREANFLLDLAIIFKTIPIALSKKGAY